MDSVWPWVGYQLLSSAVHFPLSMQSTALLSVVDNMTIVLLPPKYVSKASLCILFVSFCMSDLLIHTFSQWNMGVIFAYYVHYTVVVNGLDIDISGQKIYYLKWKTERKSPLSHVHQDVGKFPDHRRRTPPLCDPLFAVARWLILPVKTACAPVAETRAGLTISYVAWC